MKLTQQQKILTIMCQDKTRWFYPYDFMNPGLGDLFVGYKAGSRISEIANDYPLMFEQKNEGKYVVRRLRADTFHQWYEQLEKPLKQVVARGLDYYPNAYEK